MSILTEEMKKEFKPSSAVDIEPSLLSFEENAFFAKKMMKNLKNISKEERLFISLIEILRQSADPAALTASAHRYLYFLEREGKQ